MRALSSQHSLVEGAECWWSLQRASNLLIATKIGSRLLLSSIVHSVFVWFCLPDSWDGIEVGLFTKTYQRKCYWLRWIFHPSVTNLGPSLDVIFACHLNSKNSWSCGCLRAGFILCWLWVGPCVVAPQNAKKDRALRVGFAASHLFPLSSDFNSCCLIVYLL